jgi:hypothetical protein
MALNIDLDGFGFLESDSDASKLSPTLKQPPISPIESESSSGISSLDSDDLKVSNKKDEEAFLLLLFDSLLYIKFYIYFFSLSLRSLNAPNETKKYFLLIFFFHSKSLAQFEKYIKNVFRTLLSATLDDDMENSSKERKLSHKKLILLHFICFSFYERLKK